MKALKQVGNFFGTLFLIVIAVILFVLLSVVGFFWSIGKLIWKRSIGSALTGLAMYFKAIAKSIDQLGNVAFAGLLNDVLIDQDLIKLAHLHGDEDETISEVLGWNEMVGALSPTGTWLANALNWLDKDHCKESAQSAYTKALEKLNRYTRIIEIEG